jgi:outer membrane protein OmpA-like peptidoglycan-associated protein
LVPAAACSVSPTEVLAGEPITATATPSQFNPKRTLTYAWTTSGGKASAQTATTQIDTTGLAPGSYKVSAHVTDGKKGMADCSSSFTVKEPPKHPPTISCSADPSTVQSGQSAAIHCTGASPDNRPLTYTWQSSTGNVAGNNENGTLATTGVTGPVTVTTTVSDDRGLTANTTTNVNVQAPPPPPPPPAPEPGSAAQIREDLSSKGKALLNVHFDIDKATIRPDSEQLLANAAQVLTEDPELYVFVDGHTDSTGTNAHNLALSKRRSAAVKVWLVKHGIATNRLATRGFGEDNPVADNSTDEGKSLNRRVEFVKMSDEEKAKAAAAPARKKATPKK